MSFRSEDAAYYLEVLCMHYPVCDQKGTQFWLIVAGAMLAMLLIRRITSKQIVFAENAIRCSISTKYHSFSSAKDVSSQACRTTLELQTFAYRIHFAKGPANPMEVSPLMKGSEGLIALQAYGVHSNSILVDSWITTERLHPSKKMGRSWKFESENAKTRYDVERFITSANVGFGYREFLVYFLWQTQERYWMIRNWMIAQIYGGSYMLMVYMVGAIAGSIGHLAYCTFLVPWLEEAAAPTNALVVIHVLLFPHHIILANYLFPVPAIVFGAYLLLADIYCISCFIYYEFHLRDGTRTTHAGAVAGALSGIPFWLRIKRGITKKRGMAKKKDRFLWRILFCKQLFAKGIPRIDPTLVTATSVKLVSASV